MLQRIQTVYLLFAIAAMIFFAANPFVEFYTFNETFILKSFFIDFMGVVETNNPANREIVFPMLILISIVPLLLFISMFLYKRRLLQIRLCILSTLLIPGIGGLGYYYLYNISKLMDAVIVEYIWTLAAPVASLVFILLAVKYINKDEKLVRSLNRIR